MMGCKKKKTGCKSRNDKKLNFRRSKLIETDAKLNGPEERGRLQHFYHYPKSKLPIRNIAGAKKGQKIFYNFVREHSTLGTTPAITAMIDLSLGRNK